MNDGFFPRCTDAERGCGWDIDPKLLDTIARTTSEMDTDYRVCMEGVELVLLSLEQLGWEVKLSEEK